MSIPETTSAEAFERYVGGKCLAVGRGEAWREVKALIIALPPVIDALRLAANLRAKISPPRYENSTPSVRERARFYTSLQDY
jgi:hypothetical protein